MSAYFAATNRNKKSICLNLKHPKGRRIVLELARKVDIVVDNFIPGKLEELGIGFDDLRNINPSIIHASISGYGSGGPYRQRAGYDVIAGAEAGLLHITGEADGPPSRPGVALTDMSTGLFLHGAILAALWYRSQTGHGQKIDASLFETQIALLANVASTWLNTGQEAKRWGTSHPSIVPYQAFSAKDAFFVLGAVNNRQFEILCERLGLTELSTDTRFLTNNDRVRNRDQLIPLLNERFSSQPVKKWLEVFEGSGMPYGPINTIEKVFDHPQSAAREMVQTVPFSAANLAISNY
ncbi:Acyl-CoA transferase [Exophiala dermatitidis]